MFADFAVNYASWQTESNFMDFCPSLKQLAYLALLLLLLAGKSCCVLTFCHITCKIL